MKRFCLELPVFCWTWQISWRVSLVVAQAPPICSWCLPESEWLAQNAYLLSSWIKLSGTHWLALHYPDKPSVASVSFAWEETTLTSPAPSAGHSVSELPQKCSVLQQHTLLPSTAFSCDFLSHLPLLQGAFLDSFELDSNRKSSRKTISDSKKLCTWHIFLLFLLPLLPHSPSSSTSSFFISPSFSTPPSPSYSSFLLFFFFV